MIGDVTAGWCKQPRERDVGRPLAELAAERLPPLELIAVLLDLALQVLAGAAPLLDLRRARPASSPPASGLYGMMPMPYSRTAGITSSSTVRALQVVMLCSDARPRKFARARDLVRARDVPAGEVARADVEDLPLLHQQLHRLPDLVPPRVAVDVVHLIEVDVIGLEPLERRLARVDGSRASTGAHSFGQSPICP